MLNNLIVCVAVLQEGGEEAVTFNKPRAGRKLLRGYAHTHTTHARAHEHSSHTVRMRVCRKGAAKPEEEVAAAPMKKPVPVAVLQRSGAGEYTPEKLAAL